MFTNRKTGLPGFFIVHKVNTHLYHVISGFLKWWVPQELDGLSMENPNLKWMMTRGTPMSGNLHMSDVGRSCRSTHAPTLDTSIVPRKIINHPVVMDDHVSIETHGGSGITHDIFDIPNCGLLYSVG